VGHELSLIFEKMPLLCAAVTSLLYELFQFNPNGTRLNFFSRVSVLVEAPTEIPFVVYIFVSFPAGVLLNGM
jgi:hypothetical protein